MSSNYKFLCTSVCCCNYMRKPGCIVGEYSQQLDNNHSLDFGDGMELLETNNYIQLPSVNGLGTMTPHMFCEGGYVYMNGDIKLPVATTVYANVPNETAMLAANMYGQSATSVATATQIQATHLLQQPPPTQQQQPIAPISSTIDQTADYTTMNGTTAIPEAAAAVAAASYNQDDVADTKGGVVIQQQIGSVNADGSSTSLEQLKQMLSTQLDYYFSRENLANDTYLLTQMDIDQYVPIWIVANFNQVKKLTKDINLITEVLRESPNVQVDEKGLRVRPNHKRCIIILREIPDNTPLEDVKNIFNNENCPKVKLCEFAHNNSWYITFESHEDAQKAFTYLREEVKEFQGKPIMARIKAKPIMNRLPLAPVSGALKNGYRVTPPPAVYDPTAVAYTAATPQRYVYATNGAAISQGAVPYSGQVHMFPFQQQPFYPSLMTSPWATATAPTAAAPGAHGQNYYEISNVYAANGLAPQVPSYTSGTGGSGNSISKPQSGRYNNNYRNSSSSHSTRGKQRSNPNQQQSNVHDHRNASLTGAGGHILIAPPTTVEHHQQQQQQQQQQHQIQQQSSNSNQSSTHRHYSSIKNNNGGGAVGHSQVPTGTHVATMTGSKMIEKSNAYGGNISSHHHVNSTHHHQSNSNSSASSGSTGGHHIHQQQQQQHQQQTHYQGHSIPTAYSHQSRGGDTQQEDDGTQIQHGSGRGTTNSSKEQQWAQRFRRRRRDDGSDGGGGGGGYANSSLRSSGGGGGGHSNNSIHLSSQNQNTNQTQQHPGNSGMTGGNGKNLSTQHSYSTSSSGHHNNSGHHSSRDHHHSHGGHHGYSHREDRVSKQSGNGNAPGNLGNMQHIGSSGHQQSHQPATGATSPPHQPPQFDLEAAAFPPLPGIEQTSAALPTTQHHSNLSNANFPSLQQSTNASLTNNTNTNNYTTNTYASKSSSSATAIVNNSPESLVSAAIVEVVVADSATTASAEIQLQPQTQPQQQQHQQINQSLSNAPSAVTPTSSSNNNTSAPSNNWSENRLSDVVRGMTKSNSKHRRDSPPTTTATHYTQPHLHQNNTNVVDTNAPEIVGGGTSPTAKSPGPYSPGPDTKPTTTKMLLTNKNTNVLNNNSPTVIKCLTHNNSSNKINNNIMADKATKTDESLINNGVDSLTISSNSCSNNQDVAALQSSSSTSSSAAAAAAAQMPSQTPNTCNVATMTSTPTPAENAYHAKNAFTKNAGTQKNKFALNVAAAASTSSSSSTSMPTTTSSTSINTGITPVSPLSQTAAENLPTNCTRLSYAQVAQHHKERQPKEETATTGGAAAAPAVVVVTPTANVLSNVNQINLDKPTLVEKDAKKKDAIVSGTSSAASVRVDGSKDREAVREHRHNSANNRNRDQQAFKEKTPRERRDTGDSGSGAAVGNRRRN